jgi:hypothetical protein
MVHDFAVTWNWELTSRVADRLGSSIERKLLCEEVPLTHSPATGCGCHVPPSSLNTVGATDPDIAAGGLTTSQGLWPGVLASAYRQEWCLGQEVLPGVERFPGQGETPSLCILPFVPAHA